MIPYPGGGDKVRGGAGGWTAGERPKRPVEGADGGGVSSTAPARPRASTPVFVRPVRFRAAKRTDGTGWTAETARKRPVEGATMRPDVTAAALSPGRADGLEGRFRASCAILPGGVPRGTGWTAGGRDGKRAQGVAPRPSLSAAAMLCACPSGFQKRPRARPGQCGALPKSFWFGYIPA